MEATPQRAQITESREATSGTSVKNALDKGRRRRQLLFIARLLSYCEFACKARDLKSSPYTRGQRQQQPGQQSGREKCKSNQDERRLPRHAWSEIERWILRIGNGKKKKEGKEDNANQPNDNTHAINTP